VINIVALTGRSLSVHNSFHRKVTTPKPFMIRGDRIIGKITGMKAFLKSNRNAEASFLVFRQNLAAGMAIVLALLVFIPGRSVAARIRHVPIPTGSQPISIIFGPDGNFWFTEGATGHIGFITPNGHITEIKFSDFDASSGITTGPDGNIWFTDVTGNNIWRVNIVTHELTMFPVPTPGAFPNDITTGGDGNLWFTESR
jgi:streptogramin lyase